MKKRKYDIVIIGGSIGGTLAALSCAKMGKRVVLTEETKWIGGQFTNQAVPADEHRWVEEFGCTATYRQFRDAVRDYYKNHPYIKEGIKSKKNLNPGEGWVSRICHEPRVSLKILEDMLLPYINKGSITILTETKAIYSKKVEDDIKSITVKSLPTNELIELIGKYYLDATDTGELLPLTSTEYITGAESKDEFNEPHALDTANCEDMQPTTWVAALEYIENEDHTIEKPEMYDFFRNYQMNYDDDVILSWYAPDPDERKKRLYGMFDWITTKDGQQIPPLFTYRRIINKNYFKEEFKLNDVTLLNWPMNDYYLGNIFDNENSEYHKYMAKQQTLSLVYWLQTEADRPDGGKGFKGLKLRGDVLGTEDGLAMAPYIRESRRIKAKFTVVEQDINADIQKTLPHFWDTVGIGCYHIDIHMTTVSNSYFYHTSWPFEIPLGSMIPIKTKNLIASCKNLGTTHLTNGCYRLHPVEWNIGEVAGYLASYCINHNITPAKLYEDKYLVEEFQQLLIKNGIELHWPEDKVHAI
ncbi:FAD-dependent oxidoreductase [Mycoplasmatota bacterium]|nr:FAD-dependent oxidoreductase [Mycoplasmatota bacterium]